MIFFGLSERIWEKDPLGSVCNSQLTSPLDSEESQVEQVSHPVANSHPSFSSVPLRFSCDAEVRASLSESTCKWLFASCEQKARDVTCPLEAELSLVLGSLWVAFGGQDPADGLREVQPTARCAGSSAPFRGSPSGRRLILAGVIVSGESDLFGHGQNLSAASPLTGKREHGREASKQQELALSMLLLIRVEQRASKLLSG